MNRYPTRYVFLRDRRAWTDCALEGLEADADGWLSRRRVPGLSGAETVDIKGPYAVPPSGIAASRGMLAVTETAADRVRLFDGACGTETLIPAASDGTGGLSALDRPAGIVLSGDWLWVADSGHNRAVCFSIGTLQPIAVVEGLDKPTSLALDRNGRLHVVESGAARVRRFTPWLEPDEAFDAEVAAALGLAGRIPGPFMPLSIAVSDAGELLVSEETGASVLRFDEDGGWVGAIGIPGVSPGAIAVSGATLAVADRIGGRLSLTALPDGSGVTELPGFRGPVSALSFDDDGNLLVKTGDDGAFHTLRAASTAVGSGTVTAGPFDAGEGLAWWRAVMSADAVPGGVAALDVWQTDDAALAPAATDWQRLPAASALVPPPASPGIGGRFLWLRATLTGRPDEAGPVLEQVRAETRGEDFLDYLPMAYRNADAPGRFLERLLAHTQDQLSALEDHVDTIEQRLTGAFAPEDDLDWLAAFMAFDLPVTLTGPQKRALLPKIVALQDRRGTPASLVAAVELLTGIRPVLHEAFRDRRIWLVDGEEGARLGFDTGLPATEPEGIVVADPVSGTDADFPSCAPAIGSFTAGESLPLAADAWGSDLFSDTAHLFHVTVPADLGCEPDMLDAIRALIEREKPAHTACELCLVPDALRVGEAARVGIDAVVAGPPPAASLDSGSHLGEGFVLGDGAAVQATYRPPSSSGGQNNHGARP